jgi:hypothetical protein
MTNHTGNPATHLNAYTVEEYDNGQGKKVRRWTRIGAAFPHKEGAGLNVELRALPVDGRIVLLPPDPDGGEADRTDDRGNNRRK